MASRKRPDAYRDCPWYELGCSVPQCPLDLDCQLHDYGAQPGRFARCRLTSKQLALYRRPRPPRIRLLDEKDS